MRINRLLFTAFLGLFALTLGAQDVHYTLHNYAPLWLNPANTGSFSGSVRVGGIYRGQWHSLNGISSPTAYADAPLAFGLRKQDWVGVGFSLVSDNAGDFNISSTFFGFSGSYHLALDKKRENVVTLGVQYGSTSYGLKVGGVPIQERNITTDLGGQGLEGSEFPMTSDDDMGNSNSYNDLNAGVKLKVLMDKKKDNIFEAGVAMLHLNAPKRQSLTTIQMVPMGTDPTALERGGDNDEDTRRRKPTIHAHARLDMEMSEKWRFQPTAFFQTANSTSSLSLQAWGRRALKNDMGLRMGLGYRTGDAAKVLVGIDSGQLRAALSYDITLSQARNANSYQGAFEVSAAYIFNIYKKPVVTPKILCPRL
jgi:type IX secretion system PorP/SprF family membrane protein